MKNGISIETAATTVAGWAQISLQTLC